MLLFASAIGWIALAFFAGSPSPHATATMRHLGHTSTAPSSAMPMAHAASHFAAMWLAMILAMAPLLLLRELGLLWRNSLRRLRHLTIAWFVTGYLAIALMLGVVVGVLFGWANGIAWRVAVSVAAVGCWQCSPLRQRCLNACHRVPALRVFGAAAQFDSLRFGAMTGCYCAATCGLVMFLALLVQGHHLMAMATATAAVTFERHLPARRPRWQLPLLQSRSLEWPEPAGL